ncbi:unnamed protein product [Dicrocoelium dendriticum]|nr:unnamed protein product [Dicrocoelium dendriticum]
MVSGQLPVVERCATPNPDPQLCEERDSHPGCDYKVTQEQNIGSGESNGIEKISQAKELDTAQNAIKRKGSKQWPPVLWEELQLHMLDAFCVLGPALHEEFLMYNGPSDVVQLLQWYQENYFVGFGNSFHGSGGRGNGRSQVRYMLRLIRNFMDLDDERLIQAPAQFTLQAPKWYEISNAAPQQLHSYFLS